LTAVLVVGWLGLAGVFLVLAAVWPDGEMPRPVAALSVTAAFGLWVVLPALTDAAISAWRVGAAEPWPATPSYTPFLACLGGLAINLLPLLVLEAGSFLSEGGRDLAGWAYHNQLLIVVYFVIGMVGVFMGGIGSMLWGAFAGGPRPQPRPR
jgi:hypothetical protein